MISKQIVLTNSNDQSVRRICVWILGLKGLKHLTTSNFHVNQSTLNFPDIFGIRESNHRLSMM